MDDDKKTSEVAKEATEDSPTDSAATESNDNPSAEELANVKDQLDTLIRERLDALAASSKQILDALEAVRSSMAAFVEGGATIHEDKEDAAEEAEDSEEETDLETPLDELDFDLDD